MTSKLSRPRTSITGLGALAGAALFAGACGSSASYNPAPDGGDGGSPDRGGDAAVACTVGGTGQLVLAVTGLPAGTVPMVRIVGGGLASPMVLSVGTPVTLDARGGYQIEWRRVKTAPATGSIVGKAFYASASSFDGCVTKDGTLTATLTYTQEPGSEKLWMTVSNTPMPALGHVLGGFDGTAIAASGMKNPSVWKSKNITGGGAGAFDFSGNLWLPAGDSVVMYAMSTLGTSSELAPAVTLSQPATASAKYAAFDADGNLWVSRGAPRTDHSVVRYDRDQLDASGSPTPTVVLKGPDLTNPAGLAFDKFGDLWVANDALGTEAKVVKFTAAHLAASYTGPGDVVLTAKSGPPIINTYITPGPLAFDKAGNLWAGFDTNLIKFTVAQQAATALVDAPFVQSVGVAALPTSLLFDESGGLWVVGSVGKFLRIPAAALGVAGDATPDIVIESSEIGYAEQMVLNPAPTWSPIHDWL